MFWDEISLCTLGYWPGAHRCPASTSRCLDYRCTLQCWAQGGKTYFPWQFQWSADGLQSPWLWAWSKAGHIQEHVKKKCNLFYGRQEAGREIGGRAGKKIYLLRACLLWLNSSDRAYFVPPPNNALLLCIHLGIKTELRVEPSRSIHLPGAPLLSLWL